jgi:hypothetical protein
MGPLDKFILADDAMEATASGFNLKLRSHWYRSLPLSSLGKLAVRINGKIIPHTQMKIELDGENYSLDQIPGLYKTYWFILDPLVMHVIDDTLHLTKGDRYEVEVEMGLLIPYVLTGKEEQPLLASSVVSKNLICN